MPEAMTLAFELRLLGRERRLRLWAMHVIGAGSFQEEVHVGECPLGRAVMALPDQRPDLELFDGLAEQRVECCRARMLCHVLQPLHHLTQQRQSEELNRRPHPGLRPGAPTGMIATSRVGIVKASIAFSCV